MKLAPERVIFTNLIGQGSGISVQVVGSCLFPPKLAHKYPAIFGSTCESSLFLRRFYHIYCAPDISVVSYVGIVR